LKAGRVKLLFPEQLEKLLEVLGSWRLTGQQDTIGHIRAGFFDGNITSVSETIVDGAAHCPRDKPSRISGEVSESHLVLCEPLRHFLELQCGAARSHLENERYLPEVVEFEEPLVIPKRRSYNVCETRWGPVHGPGCGEQRQIFLRLLLN